MDSFACSSIDMVTLMSDSIQNNKVTGRPLNPEAVLEGLTEENDLLMEQILDNLNSTPIGQVLKTIASFPDGSRQKVLNVRKQLTEGRYNLDDRLDVALEKVLDDLDT
jgi:hypothetical protein